MLRVFSATSISMPLEQLPHPHYFWCFGQILYVSLGDSLFSQYSGTKSRLCAVYKFIMTAGCGAADGKL